jgi:phosphodiesterase/alkaline phosphatase D-like protein
LANLTSQNTYYYAVGDGNTWSDTYSFVTFVSGPAPAKIAVIGDMGANDPSNNTIKQLTNLVSNRKLDFIFHTGDISYADGYQHRWDEYMRKIQPFSAQTAYMVCPGNHEIGVVALLNLTGYHHRYSIQ